MTRATPVLACVLLLHACASGADRRFGAVADGGTQPTGSDPTGPDAQPEDVDAGGGSDAGPAPAVDAGDVGSGVWDAGADVREDAGVDASADTGVDAGALDRCAGVDCSGLASTCRTAACDPATGACVTSPRGEGEACGVDRACAAPRCMAGTCVDVPRTGSSCDDGNACTLADRCDAAGTCVGGSSAAVCGDGACNCGETHASCPSDCPRALPANACTAGAQNRDRCSNARIIGRGAAAATWASGTQNTCGASNRHSGECGGLFDVGNDHTYALYVQAGERVVATLGTTSTRCSSGEEFHSRLKMKFHANVAAEGATSCPSLLGCWGGPRRFDDTTYARTYDVTEDGWLFVIVDGGASGLDQHRGHYTLQVALSRCDAVGCGC